MDGLTVSVEGLDSLLAELRAVDDATPRELGRLGRDAAARLHAATVALVPPGGTGQMAAQWRPFATRSGFGVRNRHPGAGVVEFAHSPYQRRTPTGGSTTVQPPTRIGPAPRMAWRAGPPLEAEVFRDFVAALDRLLRLHGWGEVVGGSV